MRLAITMAIATGMAAGCSGYAGAVDQVRRAYAVWESCRYRILASRKERVNVETVYG